MFWLTASPRPCPSGFVVKNGLKSSRHVLVGMPGPWSATRMTQLLAAEAGRAARSATSTRAAAGAIARPRS